MSLHQRLGQKFMRTEYKTIRENVLYEQEKGMFPATQEIIEGELRIEKLKKLRTDLDAKYEQIRKDRTAPLKEFRYSNQVMDISEAIDRYLELKTKVEIIDEQLEEERTSLTTQIDDLQHDKKSPTKRTYVLACTNIECKGMLSIENKNQYGHYVCSICDKTTCCECKLSIDNDGNGHKCDPDVLKSVQFLKSTSKPCPSCGIPIHKISGCSQMFCTSCHASFDWNTLRLNNGSIHNPYHAEWLRENRNRPREIGDIQCGRELTIEVAVDLVATLDAKIDKSKELSDKDRQSFRSEASYLFEAIRVALHHHHETLPSLNRRQYGHHTNQRLRIDLLKGYMSEQEFRREIQRRDKANSRKNDLIQIILTYRDSLTDMAWNFVQHGKSKKLEEWMDFVVEIRALEAYVDGCFEKIAVVYGSSNPYTIMTDRSFR